MPGRVQTGHGLQNRLGHEVGRGRGGCAGKESTENQKWLPSIGIRSWGKGSTAQPLEGRGVGGGDRMRSAGRSRGTEGDLSWVSWGPDIR